MNEAMLVAENLSAWYGAARILYDLNFQVNRGEVVAMMGRNGAGKSTTMKTIIGLMARRQGTVRFNGEDISNRKPFEIARRGLGFTPEDRRIFVDLTVMENLDVGRQLARHFADGRPAPSWTPEQLFRLFPNLAEMPDRLGGRMSGGEQQMLTVARTLMGNPLLVLLDEPSEGVAPLIVEQMANTILELKSRVCRSCCRNRTSILPALCRIGSTFSKRVKFIGRARSPSSTPTRRCKGLI